MNRDRSGNLLFDDSLALFPCFQFLLPIGEEFVVVPYFDRLLSAGIDNLFLYWSWPRWFPSGTVDVIEQSSGINSL